MHSLIKWISTLKKQPITFWGLLVCIVVYIATNSVWIHIDSSPPIWDIAGHSHRAAVTADLIANLDFASILTYDTIYPPFAYSVTALHFLIFGFQTHIPQYSNIFFVIVYVWAMWEIGKRFFKRSEVSLVAIIISLLYPLLAHFTRIYELDFAQLAMVCAAIAVWFKTDQLQNKKWSIGFGGIVACALLTKWTAILFLIGPLGFFIIEALYQKRHDKRFQKIVIQHLIFAIVTAVIIAGPWFVLHLKTILISAHQTRNNIFSVPYENLWSLGNVLFYPSQVLRTITWPLLLFSLGGSIVLYRKNRRAFWFLLTWILVPYLLMTFVLYSKESRYFLSAYPVLAFTAASILLLEKKRIAWALCSIMVLLGVWVWSETTIGYRLFPQTFYQRIGFENTVYGYGKIGFGFTDPTHYHHDIDQISASLKTDIESHYPEGSEVHHIDIAVVPNSMWLTAQQIQYYNVLNGLDRKNTFYEFEYSLSTKVRNQDWREQIVKADYLITKTGDQGPTIWGPALKEIAKEEKKKNSEIFAQFELIDLWDFYGTENGTQTVRLYRKK